MCSVSDIQGIIFYCEYLGHLELVPFTNLQIWMKTCPDVLHKLQVICIPGQGHIQAEGQLDLQPENKNHTVYSSTYLLLNIVHPSLRLDDSGKLEYCICISAYKDCGFQPSKHHSKNL